MTDFLPLFRAARRASTPLIAVRTPDPAQSQRGIADLYNNGDGPAPILSWDLCRGCQWLNPAGFPVAWRILLEKGEYDPVPNTPEDLESARQELKLKTANLPELLDKAHQFPAYSILFVQNAQLYLRKESPRYLQGQPTDLGSVGYSRNVSSHRTLSGRSGAGRAVPFAPRSGPHRSGPV